MKIKETAENYLETIHIIRMRKGSCRAIDVCHELGFSKPTISVAMKDFRERGYILTDHEGDITLTEKGLLVAERMYERHEVLANTLIAIGVDEEHAYRDACKIEHDLSVETFDKIKEYYKKSITKKSKLK